MPPKPIQIPAQLSLQAPNPRNVNAALNSIGQAANKNTQQLNKFADALEFKTKSLVTYTIASAAIFKLSAAISNATRDAIKFESELAKIAQTSNITLKSARLLTKELLETSRLYGVSANRIAETVRVLTQAGVSFRDAAEAAKSLAKTTLLASFEDYNVTLDGTIAAMKQFEISGRRVEDLLGSINQVSKKYAVESTDLVETIRKAGGVFATTGGSIEELLALFTSVRGTTRESADTIATGLRTIFSRLQRPKTIEYFRNLGIELTDLRGNFLGNFEAIQKISAGLERLGIAAGSVRFAEVVEEIGGIRQSSRVIPLLTQTRVQLEALNVAKNAGKSIDEDVAKQQQTLEFRVKQLAQEFSALFIEISQSGEFKFFASFMIEAARAAIRLAQALKPLGPIIAALAAFQAGSIAKRFVGGPASPFKFNDGGTVPGVGFGDKIPAMLTPGEFVVRKKAAQAFGYDNLREVNMYAEGGGVGPDLKERFTNLADKTKVITTQKDLEESFKLIKDGLGEFSHVLDGLSVKLVEVTDKFPTAQGAFSPRRKEIELSTKNSGTQTTLLHESGHGADVSLGGGRYSSKQEGTFQNELAKAVQPSIKKQLAEIESINGVSLSETWKDYILNTEELFADLFANSSPEVKKIIVSTTDAAKGWKALAEVVNSTGGRLYGDLQNAEGLKPKLRPDQQKALGKATGNRDRLTQEREGLRGRQRELLAKDPTKDTNRELEEINNKLKSTFEELKKSLEDIERIQGGKSKVTTQTIEPAVKEAILAGRSGKGRATPPKSKAPITEDEILGILFGSDGIKSKPLPRGKQGPPRPTKAQMESAAKAESEARAKEVAKNKEAFGVKEKAKDCIEICPDSSTKTKKCECDEKEKADKGNKDQIQATQENNKSLIELLTAMSLFGVGLNVFANTMEGVSKETKQAIENLTSQLAKNSATVAVGAKLGGGIGSGLGKLKSGIGQPLFGGIFREKFGPKAPPGFGNRGIDPEAMKEIGGNAAIAAGALLTFAKTVHDANLQTQLQNKEKQKEKAIDNGDVAGAERAAAEQADLQAQATKGDIAAPLLAGIGGALGTLLTPILGPLGPELGAALGNFLAQFKPIQDAIVTAMDAAITVFNLFADAFFGADPFPTLTESFDKARDTAILEARSKALFARSVKDFDRATNLFTSQTKLADAVGGQAGTAIRQDAVNNLVKRMTSLLSQRKAARNAPDDVRKNFEDQFNEALVATSDALVEQAKIYTNQGKKVGESLKLMGAEVDQNGIILTSSTGAVGEYINGLRAAGKTQDEVTAALANLSAGVIETVKTVDGLAESSEKLGEINKDRAESEAKLRDIQRERRSNSRNTDISLSQARGESGAGLSGFNTNNKIFNRAGGVANTAGVVSSINSLGQIKAGATASDIAGKGDQEAAARLALVTAEFEVLQSTTEEYISLKEQEIDVIKRSNNQFYSFLDTLTFGTNQEKRSQNQSIKLTQAAARGGIDSIAPSKRRDVEKTLDQFSDLAVFNGKTGSEVKGDFNIQEFESIMKRSATDDEKRQIRNRSSSPQEAIAKEIADLKTALIEADKLSNQAERDSLLAHDEAFGAAVKLFGEATKTYAEQIKFEQDKAKGRELATLDAKIKGEEARKKDAIVAANDQGKAELDALIERGATDPKARQQLYDKLGIGEDQRKAFESQFMTDQSTVGAGDAILNSIIGVPQNSKTSGGIGNALLGGVLGPLGLVEQFRSGGTLSNDNKGPTFNQEKYRGLIGQATTFNNDPLANFRPNVDTGEIDRNIASLKEKRATAAASNTPGGSTVTVDTNISAIPVNVNIGGLDLKEFGQGILNKTYEAMITRFEELKQEQQFGATK